MKYYGKPLSDKQSNTYLKKKDQHQDRNNICPLRKLKEPNRAFTLNIDDNGHHGKLDI